MNQRDAADFTTEHAAGHRAGGLGDAFVSDDLVGDAWPVRSAPAPEGGPELAITAPTEVPPSIASSPAIAPARVSAVFAANRCPARPAVQRLQSSPSGQRQMGGVKNTNRFFARRQFS